MTYTRRCAGDLAITYKGIVLAMLFHTAGNYNSLHVYDISKGGAPREFRHLPDALQAMEQIASNERERIDDLVT